MAVVELWSDEMSVQLRDQPERLLTRKTFDRGALSLRHVQALAAGNGVRAEDRVRDREREIGQQTHAETAERGRSVMAFEEDNEAEAEAFAARIHQKPKARKVSNTTKTIHVRGQIVAAGPTGYIVRRASSPRRSDFDLLDQELIFVTSDISEFVQGDYMDVRASAAGEETTFRSYLGQVYPGRFPIYRIIRDRRREICIGFRWGSDWH